MGEGLTYAVIGVFAALILEKVIPKILGSA